MNFNSITGLRHVREPCLRSTRNTF
ncbi:putative translational regulatory protein ArgL [Pseudescherichia sp.]